MGSHGTTVIGLTTTLVSSKIRIPQVQPVHNRNTLVLIPGTPSVIKLPKTKPLSSSVRAMGSSASSQKQDNPQDPSFALVAPSVLVARSWRV
ncbi:hypothetical protein Tsubulata_000990 [Turnera subulata]|uniref:Uncharacterized protein n=1 Tax=Turnera subulata TaxID=218843 RepID=A0A9Q0FD40_9ROSI|nr:hypothetical protein Tsubulata_000990 [Turnera subulata]